jgi:hypothetical protein
VLTVRRLWPSSRASVPSSTLPTAFVQRLIDRTKRDELSRNRLLQLRSADVKGPAEATALKQPEQDSGLVLTWERLLNHIEQEAHPGGGDVVEVDVRHGRGKGVCGLS